MTQKTIEDATATAQITTTRCVADLWEPFGNVPDECNRDLHRAAVYAVVDADDNHRIDEGDGIAAMLPKAARTHLFGYWHDNEPEETPDALTFRKPMSFGGRTMDATSEKLVPRWTAGW